MQNINNEISLNVVMAKQTSPLNLLAQEKFSSFLNDNKNNTEDTSSQSDSDLNGFHQTLQNQAHLNRMFLDTVA